MGYIDDYDVTKGYPINPSLAVEQYRLVEQEHLLTAAMGGLLAEQEDLEQVERILDLACGPGEWALAVAQRYPDREVLGVDSSREMVTCANLTARASRLENVLFAVMDITRPLALGEGAFDLINGRLLASSLHREEWAPLLAECWRVLTPGGIVRLTEWELTLSSSPALQRMQGLLYQAFAAQKRTFSVNGQSLGIVHQLGGLLRGAGFEQVQQRPLLLDASSEAPSSSQMLKNSEVFFELLKPYLLKLGVVESLAFEQLSRQVQCEMHLPAFRCLCFGLTAWGRKPAGNQGAQAQSHDRHRPDRHHDRGGALHQ